MDTGFSSRMEIGRLLATRLGRYAGRRDVLVLALPGGGLEIASAAAETLGSPLDIIVVRRLTLPGAEISVGAVAGGLTMVNEGLIGRLRLEPRTVTGMAAVERSEIQRLEAFYRDGRGALPVKDSVVLLIDDGLTEPCDLAAAARAIRQQRPARLVMAFPFAVGGSSDLFGAIADEIVTSDGLAAGEQGSDGAGLSSVSEQQIRALLARSSRGASALFQEPVCVAALPLSAGHAERRVV